MADFGFNFDVKTVMKNVVKGTQATADATYADKLAQYEQACKDWITNNQNNKANGQALTPVPTIPTHTILSLDDNNVISQKEVTDPTIKAPVLPTIVLTPASGFVSNASANTDNQNALLFAIYNTVAQIKAKVDTIK